LDFVNSKDLYKLETKKTKIVSNMKNEENRIIFVAREIFFKNGFHKTSMDEIAKELKISKKTIYKYFKTKEELITRIQKDFESQNKEGLNKIISSDENTILKLRKLANFISDIYLKIGVKWANDLKVYYPEIWENIEKRRQENITSTFGKILVQGKKENFIVDKPNEIIVQTFTSGLTGVVNPEFLIKNNFSASEAFNIVFDILISGILTKKGRKLYKSTKKREKK